MALALLGLIGALANGPAALSGQKHPGSALVALLVGVTATVLYVRSALHPRGVRPVSRARFVGPQPLTQQDRERRGFYGRDDEIENIVNKIAAPAFDASVQPGPTTEEIPQKPQDIPKGGGLL